MLRTSHWVWNVRDDFTYSYNAGGHHDLRAGGEFLHRRQIQDNCRQCMGTVDARGGTTPANLEALFPDPFNADTWNLAAISSITRSYRIGVGDFTCGCSSGSRSTIAPRSMRSPRFSTYSTGRTGESAPRKT